MKQNQFDRLVESINEAGAIRRGERKAAHVTVYQLYVLREVEKGRADMAAGRTITHAEVADRLRAKWRLANGG